MLFYFVHFYLDKQLAILQMGKENQPFTSGIITRILHITGVAPSPLDRFSVRIMLYSRYLLAVDLIGYWHLLVKFQENKFPFGMSF